MSARDQTIAELSRSSRQSRKTSHDLTKNEVLELKEKLKEALNTIEMKDSANRDLTEFMNSQAERINDLTKESIKTIENYEEKIEQKDEELEAKNSETEKLREKIAGLVEKLAEKHREEGVRGGETVEEGQRVKELEEILSSKEQSLAELSEFLH